MLSNIGLILNIIGTVILAFSLLIKKGGLGVQTINEDNQTITLTEATIIKDRFWIGLFLNGFGSLLQLLSSVCKV